MKTFDNVLQKSEREFNRKVVSEIEEIFTTDPRDFWAHLKMLDLRKCCPLSMEVYNVNGDLTSDVREVLNKDMQDLSSLLINNGNDMFNEEFYNKYLSKKVDKVKEMQEYNYSLNNGLKTPLF